MLRQFAFLFSFSLALSAAASADLQSIFKTNMERSANQINVPADLAKHAQELNFVFVDGFDFAGSSTNFEPAIELLRSAWHVNAITVITPNNLHNASDNAETLSQVIRQIIAKTQRSVFLIGHSRGGAESMLMLLRHYDMLTDGTRPGVRYFVTVQGALRGAPIAGLWADSCRSGSIAVNTLFYLPCRLIESMSPSIASLVPAEMDRLMNEAKARIVDGSLIDRNIFYLRSECSIWQASLAMKPSLLFIRSRLSKSPHQSDGMIPTAWQKFDEFGSDLGILPADHLSVLNSTVLGTTSERFRLSAFESVLETTLAR
jgi:pimeloyl-ACP methyl ester carboxylesterase